MFYVYDPTGPIETLIHVDSAAQDEEGITHLATQHPKCIYFEFTPEPTIREEAIREEAIRLALEFVDTISDEKQAVDLAWSDMITGVESLFNPAMKRP